MFQIKVIDKKIVPGFWEIMQNCGFSHLIVKIILFFFFFQKCATLKINFLNS